jgi:hypothetical protein
VAAKGAEEAAQAETLLAQVQGLVKRATGILDRAERTGELQAALGAIREVRGCLELLGKLNGELRTGVNAIAVANAQTVPVRTLSDFYADLRGMKEVRAALYGE